MKKVTPITKQPRTLGEISYRKGKLALKKFLDAESERQLYLNCEPYERQGGAERDYRQEHRPISTTSGRRGVGDPRGRFARDEHAASETGLGRDDGRGRQYADSLEDAKPVQQFHRTTEG